MSTLNSPDVELALIPPMRDLGGGFHVRRALPSRPHMMVGPFIFFDHMGPASFKPGDGLDVRPHPHIGLATVTYLFAGEILHRDSLGKVQPIRPGEVNWMVAGRGIAHSERTPPDVRASGGPIAGIQLWLALPKDHEETAPSFVHHDADALPSFHEHGARVRVIAGSMNGMNAPTQTFSPMCYADIVLDAGGRFTIPSQYAERAMYVAEGAIELAGGVVEGGQMLFLKAGKAIDIASRAGARVMLLTGEPLSEPRHIWWNLVSSSRERIEQARQYWIDKKFEGVPGETEFIEAPAYATPR
jgi:redox-sensitive bicupin YhaK (pirin superfamily)